MCRVGIRERDYRAVRQYPSFLRGGWKATRRKAEHRHPVHPRWKITQDYHRAEHGNPAVRGVEDENAVRRWGADGLVFLLVLGFPSPIKRIISHHHIYGPSFGSAGLFPRTILFNSIMRPQGGRGVQIPLYVPLRLEKSGEAVTPSSGFRTLSLLYAPTRTETGCNSRI